MAIGYLTIQARTAHDAIPLEGVHVRVLDDQGNVLYHIITDESGETQTVPLETLDRSFSQNPYFSGLPFSSYNVQVQREGFDALYVAGIPIYDGETAVLPVALQPMQQKQRRPDQSRIYVGRPAIAMQERRDQEGNPGQAQTGDRNTSQAEDSGADDPERILRQVVIPNPITVHLGTPNSNAANVQMSFPDYVKNVASNEIYPTWPEAALTANIYAIITFALNRIYTEWYRSRGYGFDITDSTAYDQNYVYGGPVYTSVSRIVDDIFNEYVRRQGQNAPYFTSFCNGTTVTCSGMSQWGTVTLANQGRTPLQILRAYYPNDIELTATDAMTGILTSYPGTPLRTGSRGLDVQTVQAYLNRIRRNYPALPAITDPSGTFGENTGAAVAKFQSIFGLSPDGVVGKATWYKISSLYGAVARLSELDSEGNSLGIGTIPPNSILRQGSRGQDVITLQYLLDVISQYYPTVPAPSQDGIFGSGTGQAVAAFQRAVQIAPDGIVGPATWAKLYEVYRGIAENSPVPGQPSATREYTVRPGDSLWLIAQRYGTTVEAIKALNGLTSNVIDVGQVLKIPASQSEGTIRYTVRPGDSLWLIARRYGTTVEAIKTLNGLQSDILSIGQVLEIPVG